MEFGEYPINALCVTPDETRVIIADTTGCMDVFDLRTLKHMGKYIGPNGAIREIACHPTLPYVAGVGLDRFVHVFDMNSRKYVHQIYAKQRLNTVLFCNDGVDAAFLNKKDEDEKDRASKRRKGNEEDEMLEDEDDEEEEEAYEGLEISDDEANEFMDSYDDDDEENDFADLGDDDSD
jgi:ribosome biogenesis protein NSA1